MANQKCSTSVQPQTCAFVFEKHFTAGNLAGLTVTDYISFIDHKARLDWLKGVKANQEAGKLDWQFGDKDILGYNASFSRNEAIADYETWA